MADVNDWLTTSEAAWLSGYHPERIRELVREEIIKSRKFGPVWQVSRKSLMKYLKESRMSGDRRRGPKSKQDLNQKNQLD
ncbi:MAG: helix-turn-helix domain-containing protein [Anaerolineales bacterium]|nr:helix-turn-helix domain-containing protein [Anaerolineales bacterium]